MAHNLFNVLLDSIIKYFIEGFCICVHQSIGYNFSFPFFSSFLFNASLPGFGIRVIPTLYNEFSSIHSFWILCNSLKSIGVNFSLKLWWNSAVTQSGPRHFFWGRFFYNCPHLISCYRFVSDFNVLLVQLWWVICVKKYIYLSFIFQCSGV
jgi:hypothetical protein